MASELPTQPKLHDYRDGRKRWLSTWYDEHGKRHSKTLGYDDDTSPKQVQLRYQYWLTQWNRPEVRSPGGDVATFTVVRLAAMYLRYARKAFVKDGKPTSHVWNVRMAMRHLRDEFGDTPASAVEAPQFAALRDATVWRSDRRGKRLARSIKTVNGRITIAVQAYAYAREMGLVSKEVLADIKSVGRLRKGRTQAKASARIKPVHESLVEQTLPSLPEVVQDMVKLLNITGVRPEEICSMRGGELEIGGEIWLYRPRHKLEHMDGDTEVIRFLGPKAQAIIKKYLTHNTQAYLFSPAVAHAQRLWLKRATRKTPVYPSHARRQKINPLARIGDHYTTETFRRAIHYACKKAGIAPWNPNQLRHSVATRLRKAYGIEAASVQLGHSNLTTTQIYAEKNAQLAIKLAREVG